MGLSGNQMHFCTYNMFGLGGVYQKAPLSFEYLTLKGKWFHMAPRAPGAALCRVTHTRDNLLQAVCPPGSRWQETQAEVARSCSLPALAL